MADGVQGDALQARTALEHLRIASEAAQAGSDGTGVYAHTQVCLRSLTLPLLLLLTVTVYHPTACLSAHAELHDSNGTFALCRLQYCCKTCSSQCWNATCIYVSIPPPLLNWACTVAGVTC
jgi:hypothetical protein